MVVERNVYKSHMHILLYYLDFLSLVTWETSTSQFYRGLQIHHIVQNVPVIVHYACLASNILHSACNIFLKSCCLHMKGHIWPCAPSYVIDVSFQTPTFGCKKVQYSSTRKTSYIEVETCVTNKIWENCFCQGVEIAGNSSSLAKRIVKVKVTHNWTLG